MSFIAGIHHFLMLCLEINELEYNSNCKIENILNGLSFDFEAIDTINKRREAGLGKLKYRSGILLQHIFKRSHSENFYFFDCPLKVYENHYEKRKLLFLKLNRDCVERDFIKTELQHLANPTTKKNITFNFSCVNEYLEKNDKELIDFDRLKNACYSLNSFITFDEKMGTINYSGLAADLESSSFTSRQKIEFLKNKLKKFKKKKVSNPVQDAALNPNQLSVNQIIIFLDQLGVFANPQFENLSKNKQAKAISLLVGKNSKNIKTAIEKLDKTPSAIGQGFSKDLAKIQELIAKLE